MSVKILGTGSFLPEKSVSNDDLSKVMDTSDEWISSRTGIRSRHISIEDTTSTMAVKAAEKALEVAGISAEELDHIFVATLSGDYATPSTACQVQKGIGAVNAVCMDINAACSGFVFGLNTAVAYARAGMGKKMMIIGVETLSKILDWSDRSTCVLFGDGAGCAIVEADEEREIFIDAGSDGARGDVLTCEERHLNNLLVKVILQCNRLPWMGRKYSNLQHVWYQRVLTKSLMKQAFPKKKSNILYYIRLTKGSLKQQRED